MWFIFGIMLGIYVASHDWSDLFTDDIDCTHAWQDDHCYVCGEDR